MRNLFVTPLYEIQLDDSRLLAELAHSIRSFAEQDEAGQRWSREHGYKGYTSYASLDDLPRRDPAFAELKRVLTRHAAVFAKGLGWDVRPRLDSLWVNLIRGDGHHSAHIHPHSILSGTLYVETPAGSGPIRFEDPRLAMMMAAPLRAPSAPESLRPFVEVGPEPGLLLMWESWLRHEVTPHRGKGERISISFNYGWR